jgi:hypothetical protein
VDISSASIPAVSFVITAVMPARCHQRNEMKSSIPPVHPDLPTLPLKIQMKGRRNSFPSRIATHSQLQERTPKMLWNGIVL